MYLNTTKKKEIFAQYNKQETNTGASEGQIALLSYRIKHLTNHLKFNKKDYNTERSLKILVSKRRRFLNYLKNKNIEKYRFITNELGIRK